jgi:hypothetical protein
MSAYLDALTGRVASDGVEIDRTGGTNYTNGVRAVADTTANWVRVELAPGGTGPTLIAPAGLSTLAVPLTLAVDFAVGASGARDVLLFTAPFACELLDCSVRIGTAVAASTVQLFSATSGGGAVYSSLMTSSTLGTQRDNDTATRSIPNGGAVYMHATDGAIAGTFVLNLIRTG